MKILSERFFTLLSAALLVVLMLIFMHPYHGIRHDSALYLGQALLRFDPAEFGKDLFFIYGSQASFTLLPQALAWLLKWSSAPSLFMVLTAFSALLFTICSWLFLRRLFPRDAAGLLLAALLALMIMPYGYGGYKVFAYLEAFFTARSIAEPLLLLSLAFWFGEGRGRYWAVLFWGVAALCHPLQSIPVLIIAWLDLCRADKRWLHALWCALPVLLLAFAGWKPALSLFAQYDPEWLEWVHQASPHVFVLGWQTDAYAFLVLEIFIAWEVWRRGEAESIRRFSAALLLACVLCFSASVVLVDALNLVLPTGLQLWRVQWLLHWLAMASAPWLLFRAYKSEGVLSVPFMLLLACFSFGVQVGGLGIRPLLVFVLIPLYLAWPFVCSKISPKLRQILLLVLILAIALGAVKFVMGALALAANYPSRTHFRIEFVLAQLPLFTAGLVLIACSAWLRLKRIRIVLFMILSALLVLAASEWDRRTSWTMEIESAEGNNNVFGVPIESGAQVFWDGELLAPWLIMRRPSYVDGQHTSGLLFNRGTAEEVFRRLDVTRVVLLQRQICSVINSLENGGKQCRIDAEALSEACWQSKGLMSYLVVDEIADKTEPYGKWRVTGGAAKDRTMTYYLYSCRELMREYSSNPDLDGTRDIKD